MDPLTAIVDFFLITIAGLLIAFSPMLIITNLLIVLKSKKPLLYTFVLLVGIILPLLLVSVIAVNVVDPKTTISISVISKKIDIPPIIDLSVGILLISWALKRQNKARLQVLLKDTQKPKLKSVPNKAWPIFALGFTKSLLSVTNIFAILFVTHLIIATNLAAPLALLILIWTIAIGLIPFFMILYYHHSKQQTLSELNGRIDRILSRNLDMILVYSCFIVGAILVTSASLKIIFDR